MSEQIEIKLTLNFPKEGEPEEFDLISVNGEEPKELTYNKWMDLKNLCEIRKQIYDEVTRSSNAKSKQYGLDIAKRRQAEKIGW